MITTLMMIGSFFLGAIFGVFIAALVSAGRDDRE